MFKNMIIEEQIELLQEEDVKLGTRLGEIETEATAIRTRRSTISKSLDSMQQALKLLKSIEGIGDIVIGTKADTVTKTARKKKGIAAPTPVLPAATTAPTAPEQKSAGKERAFKYPREQGAWNRTIITDILASAPNGSMSMNELWTKAISADAYFASIESFKSSLKTYKWLCYDANTGNVKLLFDEKNKLFRPENAVPPQRTSVATPIKRTGSGKTVNTPFGQLQTGTLMKFDLDEMLSEKEADTAVAVEVAPAPETPNEILRAILSTMGETKSMPLDIIRRRLLSKNIKVTRHDITNMIHNYGNRNGFNMAVHKKLVKNMSK